MTVLPPELDCATLNSLVAKHVMGLDLVCKGPLRAVVKTGEHYLFYCCRECDAEITIAPNYTGLPESHYRAYPDYTRDMNAAWQIVQSEKFVVVEVRRLRANIEGVPLNPDRRYHCWIRLPGNTRDTDGKAVEHYAPTAPKAICIAALKACGVSVDS